MPHGTIMSTNAGQGTGTAYIYDDGNLAGGATADVTRLPDNIALGDVAEFTDNAYTGPGERAVGDLNGSGSQIRIMSTTEGDTAGTTGFPIDDPINVTGEEGKPFAVQSGISFACVADGLAGWLR
jgi:hypothetical protein